MAGLRFVTNLRPQSIASFEGAAFQPTAWLLSTHRLTLETQRFAANLRDLGVDLYADNGTKPLIDQVAALYKREAHPITAEWKVIHKANAAAEPGTILRDLARQIADRVCDDVDAILSARRVQDVIDEQLQMRPSHIFAQEDFAVAVLSVLGLTRELLQWETDKYTARNERSLRRWRTTAEHPQLKSSVIFAVLSAVDYSTARSAARLAASYGADALAYGFAGPNSDTSWSDSITIARRTVTFPERAPTRYARIPAILEGFNDGMSAGNGTIRHFHALGCGAAPQFPALLLNLPAWCSVSTDATSPIMDAVNDLTVYHFDPAEWGERISAIEGSTKVLNGWDWHCTCTFCAYIIGRFGWSPLKARKQWKQAGSTSVTLNDLHPNNALGSQLSIFATSRDSTSGPMSRGRVGHNHWLVEQLCASVPDRQRRAWAGAQLRALADNRTGSVRAGMQAVLAIDGALRG